MAVDPSPVTMAGASAPAETASASGSGAAVNRVRKITGGKTQPPPSASPKVDPPTAAPARSYDPLNDPFRH